MRFTKKPVTIEAWRNYTGDPTIDGAPGLAAPEPVWLSDAIRSGTVVPGPLNSLLILTLEGQMRADIGDWIIRGIKGELYPCKHDIFLATYEDAKDPDYMSFGDAIEAMRAGHKVQRVGWNGKGMWVALTLGLTLETEQMGSIRGAAVLVVDEQMQTTTAPRLTIGAHIDMRAADGSLVIGWLASQTDMLSCDWRVVE